MKVTLSLRLFLLGSLALLSFAAPRATPAADQKPSASTDPKPAACNDTTPHKIRFVKVAPEVELEVVDWGGSGNPMALLTGSGDNAHVYDNFAFQFTDFFHVIGITRRGYLPSSQPEDGYDLQTRVADDIAVLDALGIDKAIFVGHSAAGAELSKLGEAHPARVDKLVYLDAADLAERFSPSRREPPMPVYTDEDLKSLWVFQSASARLQALRQPDQSVCLRMLFDEKGKILDSTTPESIEKKFAAGLSGNPPTTWASIKAPRLGIFAEFTTEARQPWYGYLSPEKKAEFDAAWAPIVAWHHETIGKFKEGNAANTFLLPGAPHYVYIDNEAEVVRWMREFLKIPPNS